MEAMSGVFHGFDIIHTGLQSELRRANVAAVNISNMNSVGNEQDPPYRRRGLIFEEMLEDAGRSFSGVSGGQNLPAGVAIKEVYQDTKTPFRAVLDKGHPKANAEGYVLLSNVDMFRELVDLSMANRSFQASLAAMRTYRSMLNHTIQNMTT